MEFQCTAVKGGAGKWTTVNREAAPGGLGAAAGFFFCYCTVRVNVPVWVIEPEVPVTVTV